MATVVYGDFEWDEGKATTNVEKHDVTFEEAALALMDPFSLDLADALDPTRIVTIGMGSDRLLYVVSTDRNDRLRIISARKAAPHDQHTYQETR